MEPIDGVEAYRTALMLCIAAARLIGQFDIPKLLADIDHADSIGPILDPTLWRDKHEAMHEDREVFRAALPLYKLAAQLRPEESKG